MTEAAESNQEVKKRRGGSIFIWLLAAGILFAFYESIVLMLIGMVPTWIALCLDQSAQKDQARSIGYLNFAGCLPWMVDFWMSGGGFARVFEIIGEPLVLTVMYSAALAGWGLCYLVRPFVATYLIVSTEIKTTQLTKRQGELVEVWGDAVRGDADEDKSDSKAG